METMKSYEMVASNGLVIPLVGATMEGTLKDTALDVQLSQHYKNTEDETIEAIYTFPLPAEAELMSLTVKINDCSYQGKVVEAKAAEKAYEEAIVDGDTAMRLEQLSAGLYTLNLGNLQPGDDVVVTISYTQLLHWQQDQLRLSFPTTIGQRYGSPTAAGMLPHQVPTTDPGVEYTFKASLRIEGQLARSEISSPSHAVSMRQEEEGLLLQIGGGAANKAAAMDRDIVVLLTRPALACSAAWYDRDLGGRWVGWLTLNPEVEIERRPRQLNIVVDCSGSMSGVSIQQAKVAVREIVEQLQPQDRFNIINFGSHHESLFRHPKPANAENKQEAGRWIQKTEASLGGTEMEAALRAVYASTGSRTEDTPEIADILLITDGQVYEVDALVDAAQKSRQRHFTVGVGTAVAEGLVRTLAEKTGGACEMVSPNENMAGAIVRHAQRTCLLPVTESGIRWPVTPVSQEPAVITHAFSGDTLHLFAQFDECPVSEEGGEVQVDLQFGNRNWQQRIKMQAYTSGAADRPIEALTLARMAAAKRVAGFADNGEKIAVAVKYQLQSRLTNYLVVAERDNRDGSEYGPVLRQVPQMLKAGSMHFSRSVVLEDLDLSMGALCESSDPGDAYRDTSISVRRPRKLVKADKASESSSPETFAEQLNAQMAAKLGGQGQQIPERILELARLGIPREIITVLEEFNKQNSQFDEVQVVVAFLCWFADTFGSEVWMDRVVTRSILKARKKHQVTEQCIDSLKIDLIMGEPGFPASWAVSNRSDARTTP